MIHWQFISNLNLTVFYILGTCSTGLFGNKTSGFGATNTLGATGFCQTATNLGIGANSGITGGLQNKPVLGGLTNPFANTTG